MTSTILTIEDEEPIRRGVVDALQYSGFRVLEADNGRDGMDLAVNSHCDLVLLDLMLPHCSGMDILQRVREVHPTLPVIILTARGAEEDRIRGLKLGADDYVVKPFSVKELMARVEAVMRRSPSRPAHVEEVPVPGGVADFERREVRFSDGTRQELSERESHLLRYLVSHQQRAVSRDELLANVWQISPRGLSTRTVDMHVARLREKLRDNGGESQVLLTVRGKGYMFAGEAEPSAAQNNESV